MAPWLATEDTVNAKAKPTKAGARMVGYGKVSDASLCRCTVTAPMPDERESNSSQY